MHGSHEFLHLVAATVLWFGGGTILVRAALGRQGHPAAGPREVRPPRQPERRQAIGALRRTAVAIVAGLSAAAAAIHLAAGPTHVVELGDLGLGFYGAAILQGAFAIAWIGGHGSMRLAAAGIALNLSLIAAWAVSRTVGLPGTAGPESIGLADATAIALELALVAGLVARRRGIDADLAVALPAARVSTVATSARVAALGIIALSATIGVVAAGGDHHGSSTPIGHHADRAP